MSVLKKFTSLGAIVAYVDFDFYDRSDVQAARRRAQQEDRKAIDARLLLLGFLETPSGTRTRLRDALGDDGFLRLLEAVEVGELPRGTPGYDMLFRSSAVPPSTG